MEKRKFDTDFIRKNRRFNITWSDLNSFFIVFIGFSLFFVLYFINDSSVVTIPLIYFLFLFVLQVSLLILFGRILLLQISFKTFITNSNKNQNIEIARNLLSKHSLPVFVSEDDSDLIYSNYRFGILNLYSKDVYLLVTDNSILLNVRNSLGYNFYYFGSGLQKKLEIDLEELSHQSQSAIINYQS